MFREQIMTHFEKLEELREYLEQIPPVGKEEVHNKALERVYELQYEHYYSARMRFRDVERDIYKKNDALLYELWVGGLRSEVLLALDKMSRALNQEVFDSLEKARASKKS